MKSIYLIIFIILIATSGCIEKHEVVDLSIIQEQDIRENDIAAVKVAIAPVVSQKESYAYYEDLIQYITRKLGGPVRIVQRRTYQEINDLVQSNEIDLAFVSSGPYVEGSSGFGMRLLVVPQVDGKTTYNSYIIVPMNSSYANLFDLRGKRFAFSDPLSNSGKLYPVYRLFLINETPESFFGKDEKGKYNYFYTYSHDNSIIAVAEQLADGAAVDSLTYDYMKNTKPEVTTKTRILEVSPPFGNPPVVVPKDIDPFLEKKLKDIFLNMDKDEEGSRILSRIMIDRFVNINDNAYDSVREMRENTK